MKQITVKILSIIVPTFCLLHNAYSFDVKEDVYINGFASQGYLKSSANNYVGNTEEGSFQFNEFAVSIKALFGDNFSGGVQLLSRDFGASGNNDIKFD